MLLHSLVVSPLLKLLQKLGVHVVGLRGLEPLTLYPRDWSLVWVPHLVALTVWTLLLVGSVPPKEGRELRTRFPCGLLLLGLLVWSPLVLDLLCAV